MSGIEEGIEELSRLFEETLYPEGFLAEYDQLECLAHGHGTETFLVGGKSDASLYVAKCYDKSVYRDIHEGDILSKLHFSGLPVYKATFENNRVLVTVRTYIKGIPLDQLTKKDVLPEAQAIAFCVQLCDILGYLHGQEKPVIHRDIKPQNIIVQPDGTIALIDFDIARQFSENADSDTQFFGTRLYAPPEQYGFSQTDCRTDIYSLGILLRFLLTGSEREQPDKPLSKPVKRVIDRCTAFSPRDRFASVASVKKALLQLDGRRKQKAVMRFSFAIVSAVFLCLGFVLGRYTSILIPAPAASTAIFKEPLIEAAARVQLGKSENEPLTAEELKTVRELYIFGTEVSKTRETFDNVSVGDGRFTRGDIASLQDLALMPNIEELQISYQYLDNLAGISALKHPVSINLMYTPITNISELAGKQSLLSLNLYETNVSDISCLDACQRLEYLELGHTFVSSPEVCGGFSTVTELSLIGLKWDALDGLERYTSLETLYLTDAQIGSIDALKSIPTLRTILANGEMYERVEAMFENTNISVIRQEG